MPTRAHETNLRQFSTDVISGAYWSSSSEGCARMDPYQVPSPSFSPLPSICCACAWHSTPSTVPPPAVPNDHPCKQRASSTLKAATRRSARPIPHPLAPQILPRFLHQSRRHRALRRNRAPHLGLPARCHARPRFGFVRRASRGDLGIGALAGAVAHTALYLFEVVRLAG
jgi:hypothetical protein